MMNPRDARAEVLRDLQAGRLTPQEARERLRSGPHPLSEGQRGLWLAWRLDPRGSGYNVPICMRLPGLDPARLAAALRTVLQRHPVLNHRFGEEGGVPFQQVCDAVEPDLRTEPEVEGDPLPLLRRLAREPFDLARGPALRAHRVGDLVLLVVHHIAFDGTSLAPLLETLLHAYRDLPGEAPGSDYRAFVAWEREALASPTADEHRAWWAAHLGGRLPALALPVDRPHRVGEPVHGETHTEVFEPDLARSLFALARTCGVSRSVLCLGLFTRALMRWCDQDEVLVGMPARGRADERFRRAVGYFAQMLVVRARDGVFEATLKDLQRQVFEGLQHAVYPFWRLTPQLDVERQPGRKPVFQVTYAYQDFHPEAAPVELVPGLHQAGEYEMVLEVYEEPERLRLHLKYDPALLDAATVAGFMARLRRLARALTRPDGCLHTRFLEMARAFPQRVALRHGDHRMTYDALARRAHRVARLLRAGGVRPGELVAVHLDRGFDLVAAMLGVLQAGAAYLPIDTSFPQGRVDAVLEASGVARVLTSAGRMRPGLPAPILVEGADAHPDDPLDDVARPDDLAYCIYTSGSTGGPKGVLVEHRHATSLIDGPWLAERVSEHDVWTLFHSASFDFSVWETYGALLHGGTLVIVPREVAVDPDRFLACLSENGVTVLNQTPSAFLSLVRRAMAKRPPLALRWVLVGGEGWSPRPLAEFQAAYPKAALVNVYGITETTILSTFKRLRSFTEIDNVIGQPFAGTTISLLDEHLRPVAEGEPGEMCVGGSGVSRGYLNRPDLTAQRFVATPQGRLFRSGDVARRLPGGDLQYIGRIDNQVQIRGYRVELDEIEQRLAACPDVTDCVVLAPERDGRRLLAAWFTARRPLDVEALRASLRTVLPDYMIPALVQLDSLPLTPNGKVDRDALARRPIAFTVRDVAPSSDLEGRILAVWREVLGHDRVGVDDAFFEAGGDSILAATLASRLAAVLDRDLAVADVFRFPTVRELARHLGGEPAAPPSAWEAPMPAPADPDAYGDAIAIVGMSCALPGAPDPRAFWALLCEGREGVRFVDPDEVRARGVDPDVAAEPGFVPIECAMDDIDTFDPAFFRLSPHQAELMDPQMRQLLMHAWKAVEDAGYRPDQIEEAGVFTASSNTGYHGRSEDRPRHMMEGEAYLSWIMAQGGTAAAMISNRLGLRGTSCALHANCASSLVALQTAMQHLRAGDLDVALVGAATLFAEARPGYVHREGMTFSSDGHCRPFDAAADGMVGGQGVAVVVLKRAADAIAAGDNIYALVRGLAVSNDGGAGVGFFAPAESGQVRAVERVHATTGISPETIRFVEAHGTGTRLGDPIEVAALASVYRRYTDRRQFCGLGSVKSNIGHLDTAAGLAACIKVALALHHGVIPPTINVREPNPAIDFERSPFYVLQRLERWEGDGPLRAAVSSFGIGGTNAHAILERYPAPSPAAEVAGPAVVLLSARDPERLRASAAGLLAFLEQGPAPRLADLAYTLQVGRVSMACRAVFHVADLDALRAQLAAFCAGPVEGPSEASRELCEMLSRDPEHRRLVDGWLRAGQLRKCADLWLRGLDVDWSAVPAGPRRVSLPTYPFARERFALGRPSTARVEREVAPRIHDVAAPAPPGDGVDPVRGRIVEHLAHVLGMSPERIEPARPLGDYGLDSVLGVTFLERLGRDVGRRLAADLLYDFPTVERLARHLGDDLEVAAPPPAPSPDAPSTPPREAPSAPPRAGETIPAPVHAPHPVGPFDVAVVSVAGRFPDAADVDAFWDNLAAGHDAVTDIPASRWDVTPYWDPNPHRLGTIYCRWGAFLDDVDGFDADFFGIPAREVPWYSPAERLFLEVAWTAVERAGYTRARLRDGGRVGVFVGADHDDHAPTAADPVQRAVLSVTASQGALASRVSQFLDLQGPSETVSTPGSSSLAALHAACESLRSGACALALVGGVNLHLGPDRYRGLCSLGLLASHPAARGLDDAEGYIPAEAVVAVLLKPLTAAVRDGDPVLAVVKATAARHGGQGLGLTAPSPAAQAQLMGEALARGGLDGEAVDWVETCPRGRASSTERSAVARVVPAGCAVGSAAALTGHAEAAAGLVGVIHALHQIRQGRRLALITAFGSQGSNAVAVLAAPPPPEPVEDDPPAVLAFPLSARTPAALEAVAARLLAHLHRHPELRLADVAYTLQQGREAMACRAVVEAADRDALLHALAWFPSGASGVACAPPARGRIVVLPTYPFQRRPFRIAGGPPPTPCPPDVHQIRQALAADDRVDVIERRLRLKVDPREIALYDDDALAAMLADRALGRFPLSEGQKGLWLLYRLDPESSAYNAAVAVRIRDPRLPVDLLGEAVRHVVAWHPQLAVRIGEGGEPTQRPAERAPTLLVEGPVEGDLRAFLAARAARPLRLEEAPPARFELFESGPDEHVLLITVHHIVNDGTSLMVLWESLAGAYGDLQAGRSPRWRGPRATYRQFVEEERALLASAEGQALLDWWRARLGGAPPLLDLPTDGPRGPAGPRGQRTIRIDGHGPRALAAALRVPESALFLALFKVLLLDRSGQHDLVVGMPTLGRPDARFGKVLGYFVNMIAVRSRLDPHESFTDFVTRLRGLLMEDLRHAAFPFPVLVRELAPPRVPFRQPVFSVSFAYQNFMRIGAYRAPAEDGGAAFEFIEDVLPVGDGDLALSVMEDGAAFRLGIDYDGALFRADTVDGLLDQLRDLAARVARSPQLPLRALTRVGEPLAGPPADLADSVVALIDRHPGRTVAVTCGGQSLTFAQLRRRAGGVARALVDRGAGLVAVSLERGLDLAAALLGVLRAGAAFVVLDPDLPPARRDAIVADAGADLLLSRRGLVADCPLPRLDLEDAPERVFSVAVEARAAAYVVYTSGSTGQPKGVVVEHGMLATHCLAMVDAFALTPADRVLQFASFSFDVALEQLFAPLVAGARVVMRPDDVWTPRRCLAVLREEGVTVADFPPAYFAQLVSEWQAVPSLRLVVLGGDIFPAGAFARFRELDAVTEVVNAYGPTEATVTATLHRAAGSGPQPIGRPLAGRRIYVLDDALEPVPPGTVGELYIGGAGVARGYLGDPALTAARFLPDPFVPGRMYRTGDRARVTADGVVEFVGRVDREVKVRGYRVAPEEIEQVLLSHPGVRSAVVGLEGDQLVARVEADDDVRAWLAERLPAHMVPRVLGLEAPFEPPADAREALLAALWEEALGVTGVGRHDSFFQRGGDSILALRVVARAQAEGLALRVQDFFTHQVLADLAAHAAVAAPRVEVPQEAGPVPLTPIQLDFFERDMPERNRHNLALMLVTRPGLDPARLRQALEVVVARHDALRLSFRDGVQWCASSVAPAVHVESGLERLDAVVDALQGSLDIEAGPLFQVAWFDAGEAPGRLLIVVHHLAVDGVSLRILAEDLAHAYEGRPLLPGSSYAQWARRLEAYAQSAELEAEAPLWLERVRSSPPLPPDADADGAPGCDVLWTSLPIEGSVLPDLDEALLAALVETVTAETGGDGLLVERERHGREERFPEVDVARTVGWFTAPHPVYVERHDDQRAAVRRALARVPGQGAGFNVMFHLAPEPLRSAVRALPRPQVAMNYMGRFDPSAAIGPFVGVAPESPGTSWGAGQVASTDLMLTAVVREGELILSWFWNTGWRRRASVQALAEDYQGRLGRLLAPHGEQVYR